MSKQIVYSESARHALLRGVNQLADASIVAAKVRESRDRDFGFNAATEAYEDLVKAGVIDPTKVVALRCRMPRRIAGLLLTTEALVSELPEEKKAAAAPHSPEMDY